MADATRNVFISHIHEDDDGLQKLKDLLGTKGIEIRDSSIHSGKPNDATSEEYIKTILAPQIQCGLLPVRLTPA
jgi:hypothetical protein